MKSCPNLAEDLGTSGANSGADAPPKQQDREESDKVIGNQAMTIKMNSDRRLDISPLLVAAPSG
jgi:hypothetical protein